MRDGITTIAFVMILMVAIGIAGTSIFLSRSAGRSTQWFLQAQRSQDLASTALKVVVGRLEVLGVEPDTRDEGPLQQLVDDLRGAGAPAAAYPLLTPGQRQPWAADLTAKLAAWSEGSPDVTVTAKTFQLAPLWSGMLEDVLPAGPGERRGTLQLTSSARTVGRDGRTVERTLVLERDFRAVDLRPPLFGRFALYVAGAPATDPNFSSVTFAEGKGDAERSPAAALPVVVRSKNPVALTAGNRLRRDGVPNDALDRNGWVYLGNQVTEPASASPADWNLRLAHGYGPDGDTPLLPGRQQDGRLFHGFALGEERIGASTGLAASPAAAPGCAALRPWGTPRALSPTLIFGHVTREVRCRPAGSHPSEPFNAGLPDLMFPGAGGVYGDDGTLAEDPPVQAGARTIPSRLEPVRTWMEQVGVARRAGRPEPEPPRALGEGMLDLAGVYRGDLGQGLRAFEAAMKRKSVYMTTAAEAAALFAGDEVELPGVLLVNQVPPRGLALGAAAVKRGGIVVVLGNVRLEGDVERRDGAGPLTIASLTGNIELGRACTRVDAQLVATRGTVVWPSGCTINGGVAVQRLDLDSVREHPAPREIVFDGACDPTAERAPLRVLFGGNDRFAVLGGEDS